jgi:hypothetical protein
VIASIVRRIISGRGFVAAISITIVTVALASPPAHTSEIGSILNNKRTEPEKFQVIHVADLAAMMSDSNAHVSIYDANGWGLRSSAGVIPGAHLLSSSDKYDVASTLPTDKRAKIVFYCADPH